MTDNTKLIIFSGIGFVIGAGAGVAGSCFFLKKKYEKWANDQVEDVRQAFGKSLDSITERREETPALNLHKPIDESISNDINGIRSMYSGKSTYTSTGRPASDIPIHRAPKIDYTKFSKPEEEIKSDDVTVEPKDPKSPFVITKEIYGTDTYLMTQELSYYMSDGILADEYDNQIDNVLAIIGGEFSRSGFTSNDEPVIFIRNLAEGKDFKITKVWKSYAELFE